MASLNIVGDCKKPGCFNGNVLDAIDDSDKPVNKPCQKCDSGLKNLPDDPPLKKPSPSVGPTPAYFDTVTTKKGETPWGVFSSNGDYNFNVSCKSICVDGEQKFGLDGDITPNSWTISIATMIPIRSDSINPGCHIYLPRTDDNIQRTVNHENVHSTDHINVINKYKARIGTLYGSQTECDDAKKKLETDFDAEYFDVDEQSGNHQTPGFRGMPRYSANCVDGVMTEEPDGTY